MYTTIHENSVLSDISLLQKPIQDHVPLSNDT